MQNKNTEEEFELQHQDESKTPAPEHDPVLQTIESTGFAPNDEHASEEVFASPSNHQDPVVAEASFHAGQYVSEQKSPSHKGLIISAVLVLIVLFGAGGFAGWYFGIRTPDNEYDRALAMIDAMISDAKNMEAYDTYRKSGSGQDNETLTVTATVKVAQTTMSPMDRLNTAKDQSAEYVANQDLLGKSVVITKDESVKAVYSVSSQVIDQYGTTSANTYGTMQVLIPVVLKCTEELADASAQLVSGKMTTAQQFDISVKECSDDLKSVQSVPSKEINDSYYAPYRDLVQRLIKNSHDVLDAKTQSEYTQAVKNLQTVYTDYDKVDTSKLQKLENSQDPTEHLKKLKTTIEERKKAFFR